MVTIIWKTPSAHDFKKFKVVGDNYIAISGLSRFDQAGLSEPPEVKSICEKSLHPAPEVYNIALLES
ncbi:MAG: hypothetical protein WC837_08730 [Bellilinea sp.]